MLLDSNSERLLETKHVWNNALSHSVTKKKKNLLNVNYITGTMLGPYIQNNNKCGLWFNEDYLMSDFKYRHKENMWNMTTC